MALLVTPSNEIRDAHQSRAPASAWFALVILTIAYAVAFLDRVIMSLMVDPIRQGLDISDAQVGLLQGFAFSLVYSLLGIPLGLAADRLHRVRILVAGMIIWSVANMACGLATSFEYLFLARSFVGVGEAALAPVAASLIASLFPPRQRGIAFGIYVGGNSLGAIVALTLGAQIFGLADRLTLWLPTIFGGFAQWNIVFFLTGLPGLLIAVIAIALLREPPREPHIATGSAGSSPEPLPLGLLLFLLPAGVFVATCPYAMISWFPTLLMRIHGLSVADTGFYFGLSSMGVGFFSSLISGGVIAFLAARGRKDAALLTGMAAGGAYLLLGWAACLSGSAPIALAISALISLFSNWITPSMLTAVSIVTPVRRVGTVVAIYTMLTGLLSMTIGSALPGVLSTAFFPGTQGIAPALAIVYAGSALVGLVLFALARPSFLKVREALGS